MRSESFNPETGQWTQDLWTKAFSEQREIWRASNPHVLPSVRCRNVDPEPLTSQKATLAFAPSQPARFLQGWRGLRVRPPGLPGSFSSEVYIWRVGPLQPDLGSVMTSAPHPFRPVTPAPYPLRPAALHQPHPFRPAALHQPHPFRPAALHQPHPFRPAALHQPHPFRPAHERWEGGERNFPKCSGLSGQIHHRGPAPQLRALLPRWIQSVWWWGGGSGAGLKNYKFDQEDSASSGPDVTVHLG